MGLTGLFEELSRYGVSRVLSLLCPCRRFVAVFDNHLRGCPDRSRTLYASRNSSGDRLELLAKDIRDDHNGGDHPWTLENGAESTLLLYNPTPTVQEFQVRISGSGSSWVSLYHLAPEETKAISIGDVVKKQMPDAAKHALPSHLSTGEVQWSTQFGGSGSGRLLITNEHTGLKRNFSCTTYYNLCLASFGPYNDLDILDGTIQSFSEIAVVACSEYCPNCCGQNSPSGTQLSFSTSWTGGSSSYTQVANSSNTQISLQGIAPGTFSFEGFAQAGSCQSAPLGGGGTVQPPTSAKVDDNKLTSYSNQTQTDCDDSSTTPNVYGYQRCVDYQVLDQQSPPQPIASTLKVHEVVTVLSSNVTYDSATGDNTTNADGIFWTS